VRKKFLLLLLTVILALTACGSPPTCKYDNCEETELYKDGYCKYHYYISAGESIVKDIVNH